MKLQISINKTRRNILGIYILRQEKLIKIIPERRIHQKQKLMIR
jgi:hypothetical protein